MPWGPYKAYKYSADLQLSRESSTHRARTAISTVDAMQSLRAPSTAARDCLPRGMTRQLSSQLSPARHPRVGMGRQRRDRHPAQRCDAFLPWQRLLQRAISSDQPLAAQPLAPPTAQANGQQQHQQQQQFAEAQSISADGISPARATVAQEEPIPRPGPVISGSGGGIFFFWQLGARGRLRSVQALRNCVPLLQ